MIFAFFCTQLITIVFLTVLDLIFIFFCVQVLKMLFWGELDLTFTLSSLKVIIVREGVKNPRPKTAVFA